MQDHHNDRPTSLKYHGSSAFRSTFDSAGWNCLGGGVRVVRTESRTTCARVFFFLFGGMCDHEALILCFELEDAFAAYFSCDPSCKLSLMDPGVKSFAAAMF
jgi:hypothetical protein